MLAPVVTSTGAAQVAEPMIVAEAEKKSAEKRSHDNLSDPEIDAAAKRGTVGGAVAQVQHQILAPAPAQEIFPVPPDAGVEQRTEPSVIIGIPSTRAACSTSCRALICPHPPFLTRPSSYCSCMELQASRGRSLPGQMLRQMAHSALLANLSVGDQRRGWGGRSAQQFQQQPPSPATAGVGW